MMPQMKRRIIIQDDKDVFMDNIAFKVHYDTNHMFMYIYTDL